MISQNQNLYTHYRLGFAHQLEAILLETADGQSYRYQDAEQASAQMAHYLCDLGLKPGDRVSAQIEKSPQGLFLYLACLRAGLVFHPLNPAYQSDELRYFLDDARPGLVVCDDRQRDTLEVLLSDLGIPHLQTLNADGGGSLCDAVSAYPQEFETVHRSHEDLAALLYSSGTTGKPKGIMLTHGNLASNARTLVETWGFQSSDRLLHALPIFHVHGLFVALGCVFCSGASMRWLPKFDAQQALDFIPECSVMMGVPTYYTRLLAQKPFDRELCLNMRVFISGSAPLLEETFTAFEQRSGHAILERYGMSETSMNTSNPLLGERRAGTVGFPLPGVELRIVDVNGEEVPQGSVGDLQVKGPNVFKAYWNLPEKTVEDFTADGFFNTGDKGQIDADGYVSIVGRAKDMIISGGLNVYPKEIELIVDDLDGVLESAVIGLPHPDFGECVAAVLVAEPGATLDQDSVLNELKSRLANFKQPKHIFTLEQLPRNAMGKVQKNVLRAQFSEQ